MADIIGDMNFREYNKDIILHQSMDKPHKSLVYHMAIEHTLVERHRMNASFRVLDSLGKIRFSGFHLNEAVKAYNKLYNEDNSR